MSSLSTLSLILLVIACIPIIKARNTTPPVRTFYYICGQSRSGYPISIPRNVTCNPPKMSEDTVHEVKVELWVQKTEPTYTDAWKCYLRKRQICTYRNLIYSDSITRDTVETQLVTQEECWHAVNNHTWQNKPLKKHSSGAWTTGLNLKLDYGYCCYEYCQSVTNFILEQGQVATIDAHDYSSDLGDLGQCAGLWHDCQFENQRIVWDQKKLSSVCSMELKGIYNAVQSGNHIIIDEIQGAFSQTPLGLLPGQRAAFPDCLPPNVRYMDQQVGLAFIDENNEPTWWHETQEAIKADNLTIFHADPDPVNAKLQYLLYKILNLERRNFRTIWIELCNLSQRILENTWQLLRIDATLGARAFLGKHDIHAAFAGEALMIWKCKQVSPQKFYWDYKFNNKCYEYVPVKVNSELWYIIPGTFDLTQTALEVPCEHHIKGLFKTTTHDLDGSAQWESTTGFVHVTEVPLEMSWKGHWQPFTFNTPTIFHDKIAGVVSSISMLRSYFRHIHILDNKFAGLVNYTAEMSTNPHIIRDTLTGIGQGLGNAFSGIGTGLEHVIHGTTEGTGNLVSSVIRGPLQAFLNTALIVTLTALLVYGLYLFIRHIAWPKFKNTQIGPKATRVFQYVRHTNPQAWYQRFKRRINGMQDPNPFSQPQPDRNEGSTEQHELGELLPSTQPQPSVNLEQETNLDRTTTAAEIHHENGTEWPVNAISNNKNNRPSVKLIIDTIDYSALLDSGSGLTLISTLALHKIRGQSPTDLELYPPDNDMQATAVTGDKVTLQGSINLTFQLGTKCYTHKFHIVQSLNSDQHFILGVDFLHIYGFYGYDPQRAMLHFNNEQIPLQTKPQSIHYPINLVNTVCISPRSAQMTAVKLKYCSTPCNVILEPHKKLPVGLQLPLQFVTKTTNAIPMCLINPTEAPIMIQHNKTLGFASTAEPTTWFDPQPTMQSSQAADIFSLNIQNPNEIHGQLVSAIDKSIQQAQTNLSSEESQKLRKCLYENIDRFAANDLDLGHTDVLQHEINTDDHAPIHQKPYPVPFAQRETIEKHIQNMLSQHVIKPSNSPWSSPVVLIKKKMVLFDFVLITIN